MPKQVRRGFVPGDAREFSPNRLPLLRRAQGDIVFLLDRGYGIEQCVRFAGDHYQLSSRQRMALFRATAAGGELKSRLARELRGDLSGKTLWIDGFNLVIPLEIALSNGTLLLCMDGTVRDLAGLHGTYRLIDKTDGAIRLIGEALQRRGIASARFYFDAPVSNAGRLAGRVAELLSGCPFSVESRTEPHVDGLLAGCKYVVSGDSVILNRCGSWVNLVREILGEKLPFYPFVDLSRPD